MLEFEGHGSDGVDRCLVIIARCGDPQTCELLTAVENDPFDLGPADVNPDPKSHVFVVSGFSRTAGPA